MLRVLYFAAARERAGLAQEQFELLPGGTVRTALDEMVRRHPSLARLVPHLRVALNQEFVSLDTPLPADAELAVIPPVAGGAPSHQVVERPLRLAEVVEAVGGAAMGGLVTFSGVVRDQTRGKRVARLEYEAYAPMAVRTFEQIEGEAVARWPSIRLSIIHRVGVLSPGEEAVVIAASAPHRQEAFLACQFAIDRLKQDAPIWKKEVYEDGEVWVGLGP